MSQRRTGFDFLVRRICWSKKQQPAPILLLVKSHEKKSLAGYNPLSYKRSDMSD